MSILINIPAYNESKTIESVISSLPKKLFGHDVCVQVIDDGSTDDTVNLAKKAGANVISHTYNQWVGAAFRSAVQNFLASGSDIMVNIDADGQFDVADIPALVSPILDQKTDIVIGSRFSGKDAKKIPWIKSVLNRLIASFVGWLMGRKIDDLTCGFRAYNRESLLRLNLATSYTYTQETIIDAFGKNLRILWIPVSVEYFSERKSRVVKTITSYIARSLSIILRAVRDVRPIVFFGLPGVVCMIFW
jgi:glycosyltransferase involved in cell wall biosynthesis